MLRTQQNFSALDNALDIVREAAKHSQNRLTGERNFVEEYCEGRGEVAFLIDPGEFSPAWGAGIPGYVYVSDPKSALKSDILKRWIDIAEVKRREFKKVCRGQQKSMLVDIFDAVQFPKLEVPSRVRLKRFEKANDGVAPGKMYAGLLNPGLQLYRVSVVPDWEGDDIFFEGLSGIRNEVVNQDIKGGSEIVDCVSEYGSDTARKGLLTYYGHLFLGDVRVFTKDKAIVLREESGANSVKVVDVLFGPF